MTSSPPRYLLLDIGMVLVRLDFAPLEEKMQALSGLAPSRLQPLLTADGLIQKFESGAIHEREFYEDVCRRIGVRIPWPEFLEAWNSIFDRPLIPDPVLARLSAKTHLWAVSNTNKLHFDFMSRNFSFLKYFDTLVLSHEVGALKPDARVFLHVLGRAQAKPSEILFVDDQAANVQAARQLGIEAFRFVGPGHFIAEMQSRGLL